MSTTSTQTAGRVVPYKCKRTGRWMADYIKPNGEWFGIRMPLHRLLKLLRGA